MNTLPLPALRSSPLPSVHFRVLSEVLLEAALDIPWASGGTREGEGLGGGPRDGIKWLSGNTHCGRDSICGLLQELVSSQTEPHVWPGRERGE